jgi:ketosteroid isomerase-like protein
MDIPPPEEPIRVAPSIATVRQAWLDAVRAGDAERVAALATDDVVVVHGNGRCIRGRKELKEDFVKGFEAFSIDQNVSNAEVVVRGAWGFEISEVESRLTSRRRGNPRSFHHRRRAQPAARGNMEGRARAWSASFTIALCNVGPRPAASARPPVPLAAILGGSDRKLDRHDPRMLPHTFPPEVRAQRTVLTIQVDTSHDGAPDPLCPVL